MQSEKNQAEVAQLVEHNLAPKVLKYSNLGKTLFEQRVLIDFAEVAQLVEHNLAKVRVAGSSPVFRSTFLQKMLYKKLLGWRNR